MSQLVTGPKRLTQTGVGQCIFLISLKRVIERDDGALYVFGFLRFLKITAATQIEVIGDRIVRSVRGQHCTVFAFHLQAQHVQHTIDHAILQGERISRVGSDGFRVQLTPGCGIHQTVGDAHLVAGAVQAAFEHHIHPEFLSGLFYCGDSSGTHFTCGDNLQGVVPSKVGELGGKRLRETVGKSFSAGISVGRGKGQDHQLYGRRFPHSKPAPDDRHFRAGQHAPDQQRRGQDAWNQVSRSATLFLFLFLFPRPPSAGGYSRPNGEKFLQQFIRPRVPSLRVPWPWPY